uniref:hypothetical protein n=1 Tax=Castellaniella defragrans TaxID=75697 RepID=UPI003340EECF
MTDAQFDALTSLLRMTSQPILTAARLALVNGERQADAARESGCRPNHLARAIAQLREADAQIRQAYNIG